jgi:competence protein ComEC
MLWLPVALGLGIAVYYELPSEPALWLGPSLAAAALGLTFLAALAQQNLPVFGS